MHLVHHRSGRGEPLVLLHGIGLRWQVWAPVIPLLEAEREVIAVDLPGFGASPMPDPAPPAGAASLAALLGEFFAAEGLERPHVAGNSLGGLLALELAGAGLARSATALSPAGFHTPGEARFQRASLRLTVGATRLMASRADGLMRSGAVRAVAFGQYLAHPTAMPPEEAAATVRGVAGAPWFDATLDAILRPGPFEPGPHLSEVPVTVAWGEKDRLLLPRQAARAAEAIPTARMRTLTGCGHVPTYDDPEQVARVLLEGSAS